MPRSKSPERLKAYRVWADSGGKKEPSLIAKEIGVDPSKIRKWKYEDKWDDMLAEEKRHKSIPKRTRNEAGKGTAKQGAPKGNKNAQGHIGRGTPGNMHAFKHGAYERIMLEHLSDEEKEMFSEDEYGDDVLLALKQELRMLNIKEIRLLRRMEEARQAAVSSGGDRHDLILTGVNRKKVQQMTGLFEEIDGKMIREKGSSFLDGYIEDTTDTQTQNLLNAMLKIEAELDKVTGRKTKILAQIEEIEMGRKRYALDERRFDNDKKENEVAKSWMEAIIAAEGGDAD